MNDLIKYSNILYDEGPDSPAAANILAAHDGDQIFQQRAKAVRMAFEARISTSQGHVAKALRIIRIRRRIAWAFIVIGCILMGLSVYHVLS